MDRPGRAEATLLQAPVDRGAHVRLNLFNGTARSPSRHPLWLFDPACALHALRVFFN